MSQGKKHDLFALTSDWLRIWREIKPISWRSNETPKQSGISFGRQQKTALNLMVSPVFAIAL